MSNAFLVLFSDLFSLFFFRLWLSLLLNTKNNEKNDEGAERGEGKKIILISEKEVGERSFIYVTRIKCLKFRSPALPLFIYNQFWSELTPLLHVLNCHSISFANFEIFFENFDNEINTVAYNFFLC